MEHIFQEIFWFKSLKTQLNEVRDTDKQGEYVEAFHFIKILVSGSNEISHTSLSYKPTELEPSVSKHQIGTLQQL